MILDADGRLSVGVSVGSKCLAPVMWSGIIEGTLDPYTVGYSLKFRVTDVNLFNEKHEKTLLVGKGFDQIKPNYIPTIQTFSYDLNPALRQLEELAQLGATTPDSSMRLHLALASLKLRPQVVVGASGLHATITIILPEATPVAVAATGPTPPLAPEEAARWRTALDQWDSFLVFAIKQVGARVADRRVRAQLFDVLMDSRERLVDALAQPQSGPDPVRVLFLEEWSRLRGIIETAAAQGVLGDRSLEFLSFISSGDALFAFDQAAPALGMRISADDLRRLARIMAPDMTTDPLNYSFDDDPELRKVFGIEAPLETAGPFEAPDEHAPDQSPAVSPTPSMSAPVETPSAPPTPLQSEARDPIARFARLAAPALAYAAEDPLEVLRELGAKLHEIVVSAENAQTYQSELANLLTLSAQRTIADNQNAAIREIYPILVRTAAWQESCWRQYVMRHDRVWYLESKSGDIGLMQVNKYVWRGMYQLPRLKWDILYNATAGAAILNRLLINAPDHLSSERAQNPVDLARATYAAYNGGPDEYDRFLHKHHSRAARAADEHFAAKLAAMRDGQSFDILSCAAEWDQTNGAD